ncbi:MAG: RNA polymerase sigma factor region1.1 domain-containing protein, partial [Pseudomonadota bacterium]|nr:RNA polymerase sigma factor region1.1 domain-containing protein [Pseudomonadota bacterium]
MSAQTETQEAEVQSDGPLLDLTDAGVKKFIKQAKARGYVTMEDLNKVLPSEEVTPDAIEDTLAMLSEMGVNVVEAEEDATEGQSTEVAAAAETSVAEAPAKAAYDRTDDPVRMYLREMGSVELLSREGEIAIAKRIEAGRDAMISGLCESALTFEAIMVWRDELANNRILLREVIDLDATYGVLNPSSLPHNQPQQPVPGSPEAKEAAISQDSEGDKEEDEEDEDFDDGGGMSISALEAELRDGVMEVLDAIASDFGGFRKLQDKLVEARLKGETLTAKDQKAYDTLTATISGRLKTMKLNNNRIEALVEQLYAINK